MMYMYSNLFNSGFRFSNERERDDKKNPIRTRRRPSSVRSSWPPRSQSRSQSVAPSRRSSSYNPLSVASLELASPFQLASNGDLWFTLKTRRVSPRKQARSRTSPEGQLRSFLSLDLAEGGSIKSQSRVQRRVNASGAALKARRMVNSSIQGFNPARRNSSYLPVAKPLPASTSTLPPTPSQFATPISTLPHSHRRNLSNLTSLTTSTAISPSVKISNRVHALAALEGKGRLSKPEASSFWDMDDDAEADTLGGDASSIASPATPPPPASLPLPTPFQSVSASLPPSTMSDTNLQPPKADTRKSNNSSEFQFEFENSLDAEVWRQLISVS